MKKGQWLLFAVLCFSAMSCRKDQPPLFELEYTVAIEVPAGLNPVETHFSRSPELFTGLNAELAARQLSLSDISAIQPVEASLRPDIGILDYRIFTEMNVFLLPINDPADRLEIAYALDPRFFDNSVIRLVPGIADVTEMLDDGLVYVQLRFRINDIPVSRTRHLLRLRFRVLGK